MVWLFPLSSKPPQRVNGLSVVIGWCCVWSALDLEPSNADFRKGLDDARRAVEEAAPRGTAEVKTKLEQFVMANRLACMLFLPRLFLITNTVNMGMNRVKTLASGCPDLAGFVRLSLPVRRLSNIPISLLAWTSFSISYHSSLAGSLLSGATVASSSQPLARTCTSCTIIMASLGSKWRFVQRGGRPPFALCRC